MMFLAKPLVALGFGAFFLCAATCTHFDELGSPLSLAPDWAAGLFMVGGAVISRRDWSDGRTYQIAAWGFMVSLLFASFVGNLEEWLASESTGVTGLVSMSQEAYLISIGVLLVVAVGGLAGSLAFKNKT